MYDRGFSVCLLFDAGLLDDVETMTASLQEVFHAMPVTTDADYEDKKFSLFWWYEWNGVKKWITVTVVDDVALGL